MGTLLEDVKLENSDSEAERSIVNEERQEIQFLKRKNADLERQLRCCEDINVRVQNDLDFLRKQNTALKSKLETNEIGDEDEPPNVPASPAGCRPRNRCREGAT